MKSCLFQVVDESNLIYEKEPLIKLQAAVLKFLNNAMPLKKMLEGEFDKITEAK